MPKAAIEIVPPKITEVTFLVKGRKPYIANRKDIEAIRDWRDEKENKKVRKPKPKLSPEELAYKGVYWTTNGSEENLPNIPGGAFKGAMIDAARMIDGLAMTQVTGPFQVVDELIPMEYEEMILREDIVNEPPGPRGAPNLRYRYMFTGWSCELTICFDANVMSIEQLANLLNTAGFHVGVGDWRPIKKGDFGTFEVLGGK
jgi:hypothetical protein